MYAILFKYYETFIASILNETDETLQRLEMLEC